MQSAYLDHAWLSQERGIAIGLLTFVEEVWIGILDLKGDSTKVRFTFYTRN